MAIAIRHPRYTFATVFLIIVSLLFLANQRSKPIDVRYRIRSRKLFKAMRPSKEFLQRFIKEAEEHYQTSIQDRKNHIARWGGIDKLQTFPRDGNFYTIWDFLVPTFSCPHHVSRVGILGDGGKWVCGYEQVITQPECVIYSLGINYESTFEAEILGKSKSCTIYGYDFSVERWGPDVFNHPEWNSRAHFYPYMMAAVDDHSTIPPKWTLPSLMKANGHTFIDILKIDIEGAEFEVLGALIDQYRGKPLPFGQLQLEIHIGNRTFSEVVSWWEKLEGAGLRPFWTEPNVPHVNHFRQAPDVSEWSFLSISAKHILISG